MPNERLRIAMRDARVGVDEVAEAAGVDPKTAQRWLAGRIPHPRHRWKVAELLGQEDSYLWPGADTGATPGAPATSEVNVAYAHRADIPSSL